MMSQVSTSLVKEHMIGPACLPAGLGPTLVPSQTQLFFDEATNPEGKGMGDEEAIFHVATEVTKDFGYHLKVNLAQNPLSVPSLRHPRQRND